MKYFQNRGTELCFFKADNYILKIIINMIYYLDNINQEGLIMGEIRVDINLENDRDIFLCNQGKIKKEEIRCVKINVLVDTGAVMILLPQDMVETLGLEKIDRVIVTLANEEKVEMDVAGTIALTIGNRKMKTDCLVGPPQCEPLIGQIVLERLDLTLDPLKRTIHPRPESPYLPSLKLK
ncbi:MAG: aspartyl protease family protein [Spirochaetes bacterium]|nr:aspartyl protease family protein [Spirochaetota bacterium]